MKAKLVSRVRAIALATVCVMIALSVAVTAPISAQAATQGVDFRNGVVKYLMSEPLVKAPNTFEASIWIEEGAQGNEGHVGCILSNEASINSVQLAYGVDRDGHVYVAWNSYERYVVFDAVDVRKSEWVHVAVVRNEADGCFEFYFNGELAQTSDTGVGSAIQPFVYAHVVGGDRHVNNAPSQYFEGKIRQITLYEQALKQGEINRDRNNPDNISGATRPGLIYNAQFSAGSLVARDTSYYANDAYIASTNHFFKSDFFKTQDYSLGVIPDWQMVTNHHQAVLYTLPDYLLAHAQDQKIKALITVGDLADGGNDEADWHRMFNPLKTQLKRLHGTMPYVPTPGNHDYDDECATTRSLFYYNEAFPEEEQKAKNGLVETFEGGTENAYWLIDTPFVNYLIFSFEFGYRDAVLEWAGEICERYPDRRIIVTSHSILTGTGHYDPSGARAYGWINKGVEANSGEQLWDKFLRKYPNIFMTFCGHVFMDDICYEERVGDHGNVVTSFVINAQAVIMNDALENLLAMLTFDEARQIMYFNYYSTISDTFYNYQNQFAYSFNGNTAIAAPNYDAQAASVAIDREQVLEQVVAGTQPFGATEPTNDGLAVAVTVLAVVLVGLVLLLVFRRKEVRR